MKKKYEKPQVYMERFELAEHIAGCNLGPNSGAGDPTACSYSGTIGGVFSESWFLAKEICEVVSSDYCYSNGGGNLATINS